VLPDLQVLRVLVRCEIPLRATSQIRLVSRSTSVGTRPETSVLMPHRRSRPKTLIFLGGVVTWVRLALPTNAFSRSLLAIKSSSRSDTWRQSFSHKGNRLLGSWLRFAVMAEVETDVQGQRSQSGPKGKRIFFIFEVLRAARLFRELSL